MKDIVPPSPPKINNSNNTSNKSNNSIKKEKTKGTDKINSAEPPRKEEMPAKKDLPNTNKLSGISDTGTSSGIDIKTISSDNALEATDLTEKQDNSTSTTTMIQNVPGKENYVLPTNVQSNYILLSPKQDADRKVEKKGFFARLFSKKSKPEKNDQKLQIDNATNLDKGKLDDSIFEIPDIDMEITGEKKTEVSEQDLENIRKALGITKAKDETKDNTKDENKPGLEDHTLNSDYSWTSDLKEKKNEEEESIQKEKQEETGTGIGIDEKNYDTDDERKLDFLTANDEIKTTRKKYVADPSDRKAAEDYFKILESNLKSAKKELIEGTQKELLGLVAATKAEKTVKKAHIKIKKMMIEHEVEVKKKLKDEVSKLISEKKKLEREKAIIENRIAKQNVKESRLKEQEARIESAKKEYEKIKDELSTLAKEKEVLKTETDKIKEDLKSMKEIAKKRKQEFEASESEYKSRISELEKKTTKSEKEYSTLQKKTLSLINMMKSKEEALKQKEAEVSAMIDEERRIFEYLQSESSSNLKASSSSSFVSSKKEMWSKPENRQTKNYETYETLYSAYKELDEKIDDCRQIINEGELEDAKLLYNDIREDFLNAEDMNKEEKSKYQQAIRELYEEIAHKLFL